MKKKNRRNEEEGKRYLPNVTIRIYSVILLLYVKKGLQYTTYIQYIF